MSPAMTEPALHRLHIEQFSAAHDGGSVAQTVKNLFGIFRHRFKLL
jgi:hypothetical protein